MYSPRELLDLVSEILWLSILILIVSSLDLLRENIIYWVNFKFIDNLFNWSLWDNTASSLDTISLMVGFYHVLFILGSSTLISPWSKGENANLTMGYYNQKLVILQFLKETFRPHIDSRPLARPCQYPRFSARLMSFRLGHWEDLYSHLQEWNW